MVHDELRNLTVDLLDEELLLLKAGAVVESLLQQVVGILHLDHLDGVGLDLVNNSLLLVLGAVFNHLLDDSASVVLEDEVLVLVVD